MGEKESEKVLWLLLLYVFSSTWACPMQIGLSQECCLFYLKSSLWSSDLPLTFLCSIFAGFSLPCLLPPPFWTPFPYSTYLTVPHIFAFVVKIFKSLMNTLPCFLLTQDYSVRGPSHPSDHFPLPPLPSLAHFD